MLLQQKGSHIMGYISKSIANGSKEVLQHTEDRKSSEEPPRWLEGQNMWHEKKLQELFFSLMKWKRGVGWVCNLTTKLTTWWEGIQQMELDPSWRCAAMEWVAKNTRCNKILYVPRVRERQRGMLKIWPDTVQNTQLTLLSAGEWTR